MSNKNVYEMLILTLQITVYEEKKIALPSRQCMPSHLKWNPISCTLLEMVLVVNPYKTYCNVLKIHGEVQEIWF